MRKEKQIGIRVGVPAFFALELEDVYRHSEGAHRALAFPDFVGLLVGMGLESYRKGNPAPEPVQESEDIEEEKTDREWEKLNLYEMNPEGLHDMLRDFDEAMEHRELQEPRRNFRLVKAVTA